MIAYDVDLNDARIYHYYPKKSRESCLNQKSTRFVNNYFKGNASLAVASFLRSAELSKEELQELKSLVEMLEEENQHNGN